MFRSTRLLAIVVLALGVLLAACGGDDVDDVTDSMTESVEDVEGIDDLDDAEEAADAAWARFRTDVERLGDDVATDEAAQQELADACRDALEELRASDDARADELEPVCDEIRDADVEAEWDALRQELEQIGVDG